MSLKLQIEKIKENWLLVVLLIVIVVLLNSVSLVNIGSLSKSGGILSTRSMVEEAAYYPIPDSGDFIADEDIERSITRTANLNSEVKRGSFDDKVNEIKDLVKEKNGLILSENRNANDIGRKSYLSGSFTLKVPTESYDEIVSSLKKLGEVKSFNENSEDITKQRVNLEDRLKVEKERLERYEKILLEAKDASEKLEISDRIFNLERTIKSIEDSLSRISRKVDYSTVYLYLVEKRSNFWSFEIIKLNEVIKNFIDSINFLVKLIIMLLPWVVVIYIGKKLYKRFSSES